MPCVDRSLIEEMSLQVLIEKIEEYAPIVYTPTVGLVCENYGGLFRRPRGMYFSAEDRGEMMSMVYNWPAEQVRFISCQLSRHGSSMLKLL